jgi:hypothetical protein
MLGDNDAISGNIKVAVPFVVRGIVNENTPGETRSKLIHGCRGQVGVACTPKDPEMLVGRRCVVEGGVRTQDSDGFC